MTSSRTTVCEDQLPIRIAKFFTALIIGLSAQHALSAHAIAAAEGNNGMQYYWNTNQQSKKVAERKIMRTCAESAKKNKHTGKCKLLGAGEGPKYIAFFHTKDGNGFGVASRADRQQAVDDAYAFCSKQGECPDTAANVDLDEGEQQLVATQATTSGNDCRPRTQEIRCKSNCINGNCEVLYENGCKVRTQVSPRLDPFTHQWTYPSPSC